MPSFGEFAEQQILRSNLPSEKWMKKNWETILNFSQFGDHQILGQIMPIKANEKNRQIVMHHCAKFEYHQIFTPHMPKATECHIKIVIRMIQFTTVLSFAQKTH